MSRLGRIVAAAAMTASLSASPHAAPVSRVEGADLGPSMESVTAVFEDRSGFLWIGSREGLALFDGYSSFVFEHDLADPASLSDNTIRTVYEDSSGTLWIGTNTGGLEKLDRHTWTFRHHRHNSQDPTSLPHDSVYAIEEIGDGMFWIGTQGGLTRFDSTTGTFERFPAGPNGLESDYIVDLLLEHDGTLWVATAGGGLSRRDPETGRFRTYRHDPADASSLPGDGVFSIAKDDRGRFWLATNVGACVLDDWSRGVFRSLPLEGVSAADRPIVATLAFDPDGVLWVGTLDAGLWRLDPGRDEERLRRYPFRTSRSANSSARIVALLADRAGHVWLGTWGEGLGLVPPRSGVFSVEPEFPYSDEVSAVLADRAGRLWISNLAARIEVHERDAPTRTLALQSSPLRMIEFDGAVWMGTTGGLVRVDPSTLRFRRFVHDAARPDGLGAGWVWAVHADARERLWVGTGEGGLHRLREDDTFERFFHDPADPASLSDDYVTSIVDDRDGALWVGTRSGGLNAFDPQTSRFRRFLPDPTDPRSLSHHNVSALHVDRAGRLWVGTAGGGVNLALRDERGSVVGFRRLTEDDGLISNNVVSLLEDDDGSVWIGTRRGLSRLEPETGRFVSFGAGAGLASAELTLGGATRSKNALLFGTHRGLVAIRRGTPFPDVQASPTVVTAIRTVGGLQASERPAPSDVDVTVPWGHIVSFEFAVLDYGDRGRHRYGYKMPGKHDDWVDLGSRREITFTGLNPGRYDLSIRGRNDQGVWSEIARSIRIEVVPPFWMTTWFRVLGAALVLGFVVGGLQVRMVRLKKRNRELEDLKDQRERALDEVRRSQETLHGTYDRLRRLTRRLEAAKEDERKTIARELHDEMGQALTTAKLNLQLLAGSPSDEERERRISDSLALLDRMIGHVRTLSLDLRPPLLDELGLAAALRNYLEALSRRSGLAIDVHVDSIPRGLPTEVEIAAFRVIQESLTNVLRHANATRVEVDVRYDPSGLDLSVSDDGRGFDVNAALDRATAGEHVGLLGMRERVESMGGVLKIDSSPGDGTRIAAVVPLAR